MIRLSIRRADPLGGKSPRWQTYEIEADMPTTVLDALRRISLGTDPSLAFRSYRCGRRICRSCEVRLDGEIVRGCATLLHPGGTYRLEAARPGAVIRDLVFDFDSPPPGSPEGNDPFGAPPTSCRTSPYSS